VSQEQVQQQQQKTNTNLAISSGANISFPMRRISFLFGVRFDQGWSKLHTKFRWETSICSGVINDQSFCFNMGD